jgi:Spy/CpxP family protein refolding chaperone
MKRKALIVLCLVGIFAAGGAIGAVVALRIAKDRAIEHAKPNSFVIRHYKKMTKELELSSEQCGQVNKILRETASDIDALRKESFRESGAKLREMNQKIAALLTPEQNVKFEEMLKQQRERIRRFQAERNGRGDGHRDGAPPPSEGQPPQDAPPPAPPSP